MLRVDGGGTFARVSGSSLGGGTFWGLCRLLTGARSFDDMLDLCSRGDNTKLDMLVGDIYGDRDYSAIGLAATTIASSFGRAAASDATLADYDPADVAMALCRMVSYNIGHLAYLNAKRYGLSRVFFGGFFIRGHPYTMETISYAIRFWSGGEMEAHFLRHEGFLGAVGAFLKVHPMAVPTEALPGVGHAPGGAARERKVRARFVERFSGPGGAGGAPLAGDAAGLLPPWADGAGAMAGIEAAAPSPATTARAGPSGLPPLSPRLSAPPDLGLHVGVLHYSPGVEPFPLLADPAQYTPDTLDARGDPAELGYWLSVLAAQVPQVVAKAVASEGGGEDAVRRGEALRAALAGHLATLQANPAAYGTLALSDVFELREECLRECGFADVYALDKARENDAALAALPAVLARLDALAPLPRLEAAVAGVLAANIFDWGAAACVEAMAGGSLLEVHAAACARAAARPWRVDTFDALATRWASALSSGLPPFRRTIMFVDNAGADAVLGVLPLARELLRAGGDVVLAANSLPAINDVTEGELRELVAAAGRLCPLLGAAAAAGAAAEAAAGGRVPPPAGMRARVQSAGRLADLGQMGGEGSGGCSPQASAAASATLTGHIATPRHPRLFVAGNGQGSPCLDLRRVPDAVADACVGADLVVVEGMGRALHTNYRARFRVASLKLAMVKNERLALRLLGPDARIMDCVCLFEEGVGGNGNGGGNGGGLA